MEEKRVKSNLNKEITGMLMLPVSLEVRQREPFMLCMMAFYSYISQLDSTNTQHAEIRSQEQVGETILFRFNKSYCRQASQFVLHKLLHPPHNPCLAPMHSKKQVLCLCAFDSWRRKKLWKFYYWEASARLNPHFRETNTQEEAAVPQNQTLASNKVHTNPQSLMFWACTKWCIHVS